jgi:phosphoribosylformimino-5-aminoimidazole carboxamide ribotide isomerase
MIVIPAIDIKDGQCVRLRQGRMDDVTVFSRDPAAMARHWLEAGCRRLHLVDLDGAVAGEPRNRAIIGTISQLAGDVPVQVGGGIRDFATIAAYLDAGVSYVIIGTRAVAEPDFLAEACSRHPGRIVLGLDARDGLLATHGWEATTRVVAVEFAQRVTQLPLAGIVYTDIGRDGMGTGLNLPATLAIGEQSGLPVIASGGVRTLEDLVALKQSAAASRAKVIGVITGRALYEGTLDLATAQPALD